MNPSLPSKRHSHEVRREELPPNTRKILDTPTCETYKDDDDKLYKVMKNNQGEASLVPANQRVMNSNRGLEPVEKSIRGESTSFYNTLKMDTPKGQPYVYPPQPKRTQKTLNWSPNLNLTPQPSSNFNPPYSSSNPPSSELRQNFNTARGTISIPIQNQNPPKGIVTIYHNKNYDTRHEPDGKDTTFAIARAITPRVNEENKQTIYINHNILGKFKTNSAYREEFSLAVKLGETAFECIEKYRTLAFPDRQSCIELYNIIKENNPSSEVLDNFTFPEETFEYDDNTICNYHYAPFNIHEPAISEIRAPKNKVHVYEELGKKKIVDSLLYADLGVSDVIDDDPMLMKMISNKSDGHTSYCSVLADCIFIDELLRSAGYNEKNNDSCLINHQDIIKIRDKLRSRKKLLLTTFASEINSTNKNRDLHTTSVRKHLNILYSSIFKNLKALRYFVMGIRFINQKEVLKRIDNTTYNYPETDSGVFNVNENLKDFKKMIYSEYMFRGWNSNIPSIIRHTADTGKNNSKSLLPKTKMIAIIMSIPDFEYEFKKNNPNKMCNYDIDQLRNLYEKYDIQPGYNTLCKLFGNLLSYSFYLKKGQDLVVYLEFEKAINISPNGLLSGIALNETPNITKFIQESLKIQLPQENILRKYKDFILYDLPLESFIENILFGSLGTKFKFIEKRLVFFETCSQKNLNSDLAASTYSLSKLSYIRLNTENTAKVYMDNGMIQCENEIGSKEFQKEIQNKVIACPVEFIRNLILYFNQNSNPNQQDVDELLNQGILFFNSPKYSHSFLKFHLNHVHHISKSGLFSKFLTDLYYYKDVQLAMEGIPLYQRPLILEHMGKIDHILKSGILKRSQEAKTIYVGLLIVMLKNIENTMEYFRKILNPIQEFLTAIKSGDIYTTCHKRKFLFLCGKSNIGKTTFAGLFEHNMGMRILRISTSMKTLFIDDNEQDYDMIFIDEVRPEFCQENISLLNTMADGIYQLNVKHKNPRKLANIPIIVSSNFCFKCLFYNPTRTESYEAMKNRAYVCDIGQHLCDEQVEEKWINGCDLRDTVMSGIFVNTYSHDIQNKSKRVFIDEFSMVTTINKQGFDVSTQTDDLKIYYAYEALIDDKFTQEGKRKKKFVLEFNISYRIFTDPIIVIYAIPHGLKEFRKNGTIGFDFTIRCQNEPRRYNNMFIPIDKANINTIKGRKIETLDAYCDTLEIPLANDPNKAYKHFVLTEAGKLYPFVCHQDDGSVVVTMIPAGIRIEFIHLHYINFQFKTTQLISTYLNLIYYEKKFIMPEIPFKPSEDLRDFKAQIALHAEKTTKTDLCFQCNESNNVVYCFEGSNCNLVCLKCVNSLNPRIRFDQRCVIFEPKDKFSYIKFVKAAIWLHEFNELCKEYGYSKTKVKITKDGIYTHDIDPRPEPKKLTSHDLNEEELFDFSENEKMPDDVFDDDDPNLTYNMKKNFVSKKIESNLTSLDRLGEIISDNQHMTENYFNDYKKEKSKLLTEYNDEAMYNYYLRNVLNEEYDRIVPLPTNQETDKFKKFYKWKTEHIYQFNEEIKQKNLNIHSEFSRKMNENKLLTTEQAKNFEKIKESILKLERRKKINIDDKQDIELNPFVTIVNVDPEEIDEIDEILISEENNDDADEIEYIQNLNEYQPNPEYQQNPEDSIMLSPLSSPYIGVDIHDNDEESHDSYNILLRPLPLIDNSEKIKKQLQGIDGNLPQIQGQRTRRRLRK